MAYAVTLLPSAAKDFRTLGGEARKRIAKKLDELAQNPRPSGATVLENAEGLLRIRVGDYRVIYQVDDAMGLAVLVVKIGHRKDVYRYLRTRRS